MNKYKWLTGFLLFAVCHVFAQSISIGEVVPSPSKEIYDLLQDRKGFIWIADELGVRRYDGVGFTSYSHPLQSALSMTDLAEDKQGRIWCHNFNGQIFYIEHEQMHLLDAYNHTDEKRFPRIAICGDELLATSTKGLFICNTKSLASKYIAVPGAGTSSLCILGEEALLHGDSGWYVYQKDKRITPLDVPKTLFAGLNAGNLMLQPHPKGDAVYGICNPGALFFTFIFTDHQLGLQKLERRRSFINAVTIVKEEAWVHAKAESMSLTGKESIKGYNLTCVLKGNDGNTWYSSLDKGLMVSYAQPPWSVVTDSVLEKGDFIKCMKQSKKYFVMGSQHGVLLVKNKTQGTVKRYKLPASAGAVDKIGLLPENDFLIAPSASLYLLQPDKGRLQCISNTTSAKDITYSDSMLYIAAPRGLLRAQIKQSPGAVPTIDIELILKGEQRCRAVRYNAVTGTLWVAYTDGLYKWHSNKLEQVFYNGAPIYASSLEYSNGKIYAGTFSGGLIVIEGDGAISNQFKKYALSSAVLRMKLIRNHLWILNAFGVNTFDIKSGKFIYNQNIPYFSGGEVLDVSEADQSIYLAANAQLYKIPVQQQAHIHPPTLYLQYVSINNKDTIFDSGAKLTHYQNNLSFYITTPWYNKNNIETLRYQLSGINNGTAQWYDLEKNERIIQLNDLAPGTYTLTVQAGINGNFQYASLPLVYNFTIIRPWYKRWWFYLLLVVVLATILFTVYKYRVNQLLKMERLRREISSNLHDDVGSTVSSINIYSQLLKKGQHSAEYIDMIQANTVQVMNSLDDLVWNINPKYDSLEQLINKMRAFAVPLLKDNGIVCRFDAVIEEGKKILPPEVRTDFYLIYKEAINNLVKHAQCTRCEIQISQRGKLLILSIQDDGKGFDADRAVLHRNGITSMQHRAEKLRGNLNIISAPQEGTQITLVCSAGNI